MECSIDLDTHPIPLSPMLDSKARGNDGMDGRAFQTYEAFWAFYVGEHRRPLTRRLHFAGTSGAIICVAAAVLSGYFWLLALAPVIAYGWPGPAISGSRKTRPPRSNTRCEACAPISICTC